MRTHSFLMAFGLLTCAATAALAGTPEERGLEIAKQADAANEGFKSEASTLAMKLINAHGDVTERKMESKILEGDGDGDRSFIVFEAPADVKNTKMLTWSHKKGTDDQWLYLPAIKRIKRISSRNKSGSFMGSEFAYEDLSSPEVEKFTYKYLADVTEKGRDCWQMERYPIDKNSGYSKQVVWLDKQYQTPVRIDFYDRKGELLKVGTYSGYKQYGKFWRWGAIEMDNKQTRKKSIITWNDRKLGVDLDTDDFERDALEE
ncbi:MAG: outer membrane lipoprotein-sorting protein [Bradymonadia bacterium]